MGTYHRFFHHHCVALLDAVAGSGYRRRYTQVHTLVLQTSGDRRKRDICITHFDPRDRSGIRIGEIPHKIVHIYPKYVSKRTPERYREWMRAIDDTMDKLVDESQYSRPEIRKLFALIEEKLITPYEYAAMKDEHSSQQTYDEKYQEGVEEGRKEGIEEGRRKGIEEGRKGEIRKIAANCLTLGALTHEQIVKATGLNLY